MRIFLHSAKNGDVTASSSSFFSLILHIFLLRFCYTPVCFFFAFCLHHLPDTLFVRAPSMCEYFLICINRCACLHLPSNPIEMSTFVSISIGIVFCCMPFCFIEHLIFYTIPSTQNRLTYAYTHCARLTWLKFNLIFVST